LYFSGYVVKFVYLLGASRFAAVFSLLLINIFVVVCLKYRIRAYVTTAKSTFRI